MPSCIEVVDVGKRYRLGEDRYLTVRDSFNALLHRSQRAKREFWALRDVTFSVAEGEAIAVIGRNGAGKTTILKILSRITEPTTGFARVRGRVGALLEVGTGFHPELTGRENVYLNGAILGMKRADIRRRFDEIVSFAGVERFLDTPVKRYSSGMHLRLAFAVAAHLEPDIVVVDEVLAVGDAEFQRKCLGKMSEVASEGRTVVFVSHDLGSVAQMCSRAIWIEEGRVQHDGPTHESIQRYLDARGRRQSRIEFSVEPDKRVQLLSAAITDRIGETLDEPRRDQPFTVRMTLDVRERVGALDVIIYLLTRRGLRILAEAWSDQHDGRGCADSIGLWEIAGTIPPVLAAGDYLLAVRVESRYETLIEQDVLAFRLSPPPAERNQVTERSRVVHPEVEWAASRA